MAGPRGQRGTSWVSSCTGTFRAFGLATVGHSKSSYGHAVRRLTCAPQTMRGGSAPFQLVCSSLSVYMSVLHQLLALPAKEYRACIVRGTAKQGGSPWLSAGHPNTSNSQWLAL